MSAASYRHVYYTPETFTMQGRRWRTGGSSVSLTMYFVQKGQLDLSLALMPLSLQYALQQAVLAAEGRLGLGSVS